MNKYRFRFSRDKRFKKVSFKEFLKIAKELCEVVAHTRGSHVDVEVLTKEDVATYNCTRSTFLSAELAELLKGRKRYSLDGLTQEIWDRSFHVQVLIKDKADSRPFMICVSCDIYSDRKRMKFYGQCLDETAHQEIIRRFHNPSFSYSIGNGMPK